VEKIAAQAIFQLGEQRFSLLVGIKTEVTTHCGVTQVFAPRQQFVAGSVIEILSHLTIANIPGICTAPNCWSEAAIL